MSDILISSNKEKIYLEEFDQELIFYEKTKKIKLIGIIRAKKTQIEKNISNIYNNIHNFFCEIPGEYFVIIEDGKNLKISLSYSCPRFYISKEKNFLALSQNEVLFKDSGFNRDSFIISSFVHHSYLNPTGVFEGVTDFLLPGMLMIINRENLNYEQDWILPIEQIGSKQNHEDIANLTAEAFIKEMSSYKLLNSDISLQLSGGVDSALMFAASKCCGLDVNPITFKHPNLPSESREARKVTKYFNYDLKEIKIGPTKKNNFFTKKTDIYDYLHKTKNLLKTGSGMLVLNNISLLAFDEYGYHNTLENASYADALSLEHYTRYPYGFFKNGIFDPKKNSDLRFFYSKRYIEDKLKSEKYKDFWNIKKYFPDIHEFYYSFLDPCFNGHINKNLNKYIVVDNNLNFVPELKNAITKRGILILKKILLSKYFKNNLIKPSVDTAMKLNKIFSFINNISNSASKLFNYRKGNVLSQYRPGLSSNILSILLSVEINEKLVFYPKWHIFRAFEIISKKNFFEITRENNIPFKILNSIKQRIFNNDIRNTQLKNIHFQKFLKEQQVYEKYRKITHDLDLKNYPNLNYKFKTIDQEFWSVNNIVNLTSI
tara:strand:- start:2206 stop:4008 length:1803 start_codon:yes stop_codon:yes gene_type:complete